MISGLQLKTSFEISPENDCSHCYLSSCDGQAGTGHIMNREQLDWSVILTVGPAEGGITAIFFFTDAKIEFREQAMWFAGSSTK